MKNYRCKLEEGRFYHIYNRGNNHENIFYNQENYNFFLKRYNNYLSNFIDTLAFSLLPNHFHFLIRVKENPEKVSPFQKVKPLSQQFQKLFTSYSMAINKQENRSGSLFQKPFKRLEISNEKYLINLVFYIHANPQLHGIVEDFKLYPWSSYQRILSDRPSKLKKNEVIEWFDDKENFIAYHAQKAEKSVIESIIIED